MRLLLPCCWFFTGLAIVLYVNQPSVQPRERDYSYVGSFYAFAIWIGWVLLPLPNSPANMNARTSAAIAQPVFACWLRRC
jgi:hypothetical protein